MAATLKENIADFLQSHRYLTLATVTPEGMPMAHTVGYVTEGDAVYFMTARSSRKAHNIAANPEVGYSVFTGADRLMDIVGLQMQGRAEDVDDPAVARWFMSAMAKRYPELAQMPHDPDIAVYRVRHGEAHFTDNSRGFGHREVAVY